MNDYKSIELALDSLNLAEDYLTCFAMHLGNVSELSETAAETKNVIGGLRVTRKLLKLELGGLRDAGRENIEGEASK